MSGWSSCSLLWVPNIFVVADLETISGGSALSNDKDLWRIKT